MRSKLTLRYRPFLLLRPAGHPLSMREGLTQFQDDFLDFFAPCICKSVTVPRNNEPAFFHDSNRGDIVLGRAAVDRTHSDVTQKFGERLGRETHSPVFLSNPVGYLWFAAFLVNVLCDDADLVH